MAKQQLTLSASFIKSWYFKNGTILIETEKQTMISKKVPWMKVRDDDHTALSEVFFWPHLHGHFSLLMLTTIAISIIAN